MILDSALRLPGFLAGLVGEHFKTRREMGEKIAGPLGGFLLGGLFAGRALETAAQAVTKINNKVVDTLS